MLVLEATVEKNAFEKQSLVKGFLVLKVNLWSI
jgi:hypothetical protein